MSCSFRGIFSYEEFVYIVCYLTHLDVSDELQPVVHSSNLDAQKGRKNCQMPKFKKCYARGKYKALLYIHSTRLDFMGTLLVGPSGRA